MRACTHARARVCVCVYVCVWVGVSVLAYQIVSDIWFSVETERFFLDKKKCHAHLLLLSLRWFSLLIFCCLSSLIRNFLFFESSHNLFVKKAPAFPPVFPTLLL